jgi:tetratricopeptide (TPR) repeat protein
MREALFFLYRRWDLVLFALLAWRVYLSLRRNDDFSGYPLKLKRMAWLAGGLCFIGWIFGDLTGYRWGGAVGSILMAVPALYLLSRICNRAFNDIIGGLIVDLLFAEGPFAEASRAPEKIPNVTLLRHWRDHGQVYKAYHLARQALSGDERTFPLWLFAMETAAVQFGRLGEAERLARRLQRCRGISNDQKIFAVHQLKGWAAIRGVNLNLNQFGCIRPFVRKAKPLQAVCRLRQQGLFLQARNRLRVLRQKDPEDLAVALLLTRVYTQDLGRRDKAEKLLAELEEQPFTSAAFLEFARHSLDEWEGMAPAVEPRKRKWWRLITRARSEPPLGRSTVATSGRNLAAKDPPKTADELSRMVANMAADGQLDTAVQAAERLLAANPEDFQVWMLLLRIFGMRIGDLRRAAEICADIHAAPKFSAEQKQQAMELFEEAKIDRAKRTFRLN